MVELVIFYIEDIHRCTHHNEVTAFAVEPTASITVPNIELTIGETSLVAINFSEVVSYFDNADLTVVVGVLQN